MTLTVIIESNLMADSS
uniref:Uncharacterized protein n=1 Tax=Rhizophora mucronata TaxID=61149 RepID=A0A2P2LED8_RHIMU